MTTSPRPRPDLAPHSGATSPGDLAPRPPLLRRGAKSRGELDTLTNHTTTSPQGRSHNLTANCAIHGRQTFLRSPNTNLWICPTSPCLVTILDEHITPDGADTTNLADWGHDTLRPWLIERLREHERRTS